jgi:hypothetical protein
MDSENNMRGIYFITTETIGLVLAEYDNCYMLDCFLINN